MKHLKLFEKFQEYWEEEDEDNLIKVSDAIEWMEKVGEDPIVDGPFRLSKSQEKEYVNSLSDKTKRYLVKYNNVNKLSFDDTSIGGGHPDDIMYDILKCFVEVLNKYGYKNHYKK